MYFESLQAALAMDGHGAYVWGAYGVSTLVLLLMLVNPRRRQQRLLRDVRGDVRRRDLNASAPTVEER